MYYIETVKELDDYMTVLFTETELKEINYTDYTDKDKETIILRSEMYIDDTDIGYKGRYETEYQEHQFPRILHSKVIEKTDERLTKALCYIAYDIMKSKTSSRYDLINQGVKSISTAGVSESYTDKENVTIISETYKSILHPFILEGCL